MTMSQTPATISPMRPSPAVEPLLKPSDYAKLREKTGKPLVQWRPR